MSIATVHAYSMSYVNQAQLGTGTVDAGTTVLAPKVTAVNNGPATFNGVAPSNKAELDKYSVATDFQSGATTAWSAIQWVRLSDTLAYTWNGSAWVASTLATGVTGAGPEKTFSGGRYPFSLTELLTVPGGSAFTNGQYVQLNGVSTSSVGTQPRYYWDGDEWLPGVTPDVVPAAPAAPTGTPGNGQVSLSWSAPAANGGSAVTDYSIAVFASDGTSAATGVTGAAIRLKGSTGTTYTFTGLTNGTQYKFKVAAVNAAGTGAYSSASLGITPST